MQASGSQYITVEDSFSMVHAWKASAKPPAETQRSETAIVCASPTRCWAPSSWIIGTGRRPLLIRDHIAATIPG
ncbi:hypothetical protein M8494_09020 [Serratia ureilytica]